MTPGREFSVAGFDGITEAEEWDLTTVEQPVSGLVAAAYALLQHDHGEEPLKLKLAPKCVFRSSTGPVPLDGRRNTVALGGGGTTQVG